MMFVLLVAGIVLLLAGLAAVGFGIPVNEFSFGNTLIISGAVTACTGTILLGLWTVVRELKMVARQFGSRPASAYGETALTGTTRNRDDSGFLFGGGQPEAENAGQTETAAPSSMPPWRDETSSGDRARNEAPRITESGEPEPAVKPRRNLLFSSSSRKERERSQARAAGAPLAGDAQSAPAIAPPIPEASEVPATFDDAWPKPDRGRAAEAPPRRSGRAPSTFTETSPGALTAERYPPATRHEEVPPVTILKSGVVDGMAYSLYSDGSIEAQMPEGMMRFASIDELRAHLDQRP